MFARDKLTLGVFFDCPSARRSGREVTLTRLHTCPHGANA
jgi:hypothetical protein